MTTSLVDLPARVLAAVTSAMTFLVASPAAAQSAKPPADTWQFSVTPYLWLPSLDGTLRYGPPPAGGSSSGVEPASSVSVESSGAPGSPAGPPVSPGGSVSSPVGPASSSAD